MCFLFLPGVGDAKIGAAWEDGLCQLLAPCDIATIKEFVSSAFPKVLGSAQYVKICRFLGISTLLLELRQRPHHAHLTPEKLVDIIQRGGYLDRSNYFDDVSASFRLCTTELMTETDMETREKWMRQYWWGVTGSVHRDPGGYRFAMARSISTKPAIRSRRSPKWRGWFLNHS